MRDRSQFTAPPDKLVAAVREHAPELADQLEAWRCPHEEGGFTWAEPIPGSWSPGPCGGRAVSVSRECSATMVVPVDRDDQATHMALARGIDPGPPRTQVKPVAYDTFFHCEHGHRIYIETR